MILSEPEIARTPLERQSVEALARAVERAVADGDPVTVLGSGTSEHAAIAIADLLADARAGPGGRRPLLLAREAFEALLDPAPGVCIGISHGGHTRGTAEAMDAARERGATTALITAAAQTPAAAAAEIVLETPSVDQSWCHTVGYLSPILAGISVAAALRGEGAPLDRVGRAAERALELRPRIRDVAGDLAGSRRILAAGSGIDYASARELALKIEEGVHLAAVAHRLETVVHGHLAAADESVALVVFAAEPRDAPRRAARSASVLLAARRIGLRTAAILSDGVDRLGEDGLTSAGRIVLPEDDGSLGTRLVASAVVLQLLTLELADLAGTNPDLLRREEASYREAAQLAESKFPRS